MDLTNNDNIDILLSGVSVPLVKMIPLLQSVQMAATTGRGGGDNPG